MGKVIYICSPYRAKDKTEADRNVEYAKELTRKVLLERNVPVTPHLYMTQCLDDSDEQERRIGLDAGQQILGKCDEILVGCRHGISEGMRAEIIIAASKGIKIKMEEFKA